MMPPYRARAYATRHMASAAHALAAQVALQVLEAGGNAVDAGVAGGLTLNVVHGEFCHFAGVAPIMIWLAERGEALTITGLGGWPRAASPEYFHAHHGGRIPDGVLRTVVPGAPDAWLTALDRFGTMSFADVAAPAIAYARDGFPVSPLTTRIVGELAGEYRRWPANAAIYLPGGAVPQPGDRMFLADLAATLQHLVDEERAAAPRGRSAGIEAARAAFYRGDIAARIAAFYAAEGGWLSREDLAEFRVEVLPPIEVSYHGTRVLACGPWCQGPVLPQALGILEGMDLAGMAPNGPDYIHAVIEAFKLAFADRHAWYGDPNFVDVPMARLLDPAYLAMRRGLIDPAAAAPGMPLPGAGAWTEPELDTTFVCTADRWGNLFAATPSDSCFSGPMVPGTGLCPSARGIQSWTDPAHPACLGPGKRPRLTPSPGLAIQDGRWFMPFGTPGDDVQPQAMAQVLLNMVHFGMPPQLAVEAPRFASMSFPRSTDPHEYFPGRMAAEARIGPEVSDALGALGHKVAAWDEWDWRAGCVCLIRRDAVTGMLEGAADPRRPSGVAGL